jgi:hypothetical protein
MKEYSLILISTVALLINSCHKNCECFTPPSPLNLSILDSLGNNRLDSSASDFLRIDQIRFANGEKINFDITTYSQNFPNFYFIESRSNNYFDHCLGQDCEFYISYQNLTEIDTINVFIDEIHEKNSDDCLCVFYIYKYIKHNGIEIKEFDSEHKTGAAIIRKN